MKRWLLTILLFLLVGAVVNVAVAWGLALSNPRKAEERPLSKERTRSLIAARFDGVDGVSNERINGGTRSGIGWGCHRATIQPHMELYWEIHEFGIPLRTLAGEYEGYDDIEGTGFWVIREGEFDLHRRWVPALRLPLRPIWPNFAVNTLFYAVLLWLPIRGPFALRRQIRKRRGCCLKCGYPAGTSVTCTECGTASPARRQHA